MQRANNGIKMASEERNGNDRTPRGLFRYFSKSFSPANVRALSLSVCPARFILFSANLLSNICPTERTGNLFRFFLLATNFISLIILLLSVALVLRRDFFFIHFLCFNFRHYLFLSAPVPLFVGSAGILFPLPHVISSAHRCGPRFVAETHAKMCAARSESEAVDGRRAHRPNGCHSHFAIINMDYKMIRIFRSRRCILGTSRC